MRHSASQGLQIDRRAGRAVQAQQAFAFLVVRHSALGVCTHGSLDPRPPPGSLVRKRAREEDRTAEPLTVLQARLVERGSV